MNTPSSGYDSALLDLAAWCGLAHDMLTPSMDHPESERLQTTKHTLQHLHRDHLAQLQPWLVACATRAAQPFHRRPVWTEVEAALRAADERVALAACALLHRAVIAAYERAADRSWMVPEVMHVLQQQKQEVTRAYAACFSRPASRPTPTPPSPLRATRRAAPSPQLVEPLAS